MSLSAAWLAWASLGNFFVCVWPLVPSRPNSTVNFLPARVMAQNLFAAPSLRWNSRRLMGSFLRGVLACQALSIPHILPSRIAQVQLRCGDYHGHEDVVGAMRPSIGLEACA